ncbi:acyl--CoA ligase [Myxococcota bacterium]|nr:acyl--CoA ligase [Myxococcota bacterium]
MEVDSSTDASSQEALLQGATELTLGQALRRAAARVPDRPALLSDERVLTWAQLDQEVDRLANLLRAVGFGHGDVIAFLIDKRPEVVTGFLACARIGAVYAPVNFKLHPDHVRDQFETAKVKGVFTEKARDRLLEAVLPLLPDPRKIIYVGPKGRLGDTAYADLERHPATEAADAWRPEPDTVCYLNYTSGTTGRPKGARTTHRNIQENAVATIQGLGFRESDIFLGMFSVFAHPHELFHRSLILGGPFLILDSLSPRVVAEAVERFRVTWMMAVPSFYEMMLDYTAPADGSGPKHDLCDCSSLRVLESGGAFVGAETLLRMEAAFGCTFMPVWGCTEATGVGLANGPDKATRKPGATGRPVPGYRFRVVDEAGRDVPTGEVGELLMRGPAVASLGYLNMPEETDKLFVDGWYHTQDLVTMDQDGFVRFAGRRSEMLKIGGIRVYPLEIERVIKEHPEVRDVVVVRAEERLRGEIARAVVSTVPGSALDAKALQAYCRARLAVYKVPRIVEFWREVPKLANGKIDKQGVLGVPPDAERDERRQGDVG